MESIFLQRTKKTLNFSLVQYGLADLIGGYV